MASFNSKTSFSSSISGNDYSDFNDWWIVSKRSNHYQRQQSYSHSFCKYTSDINQWIELANQNHSDVNNPRQLVRLDSFDLNSIGSKTVDTDDRNDDDDADEDYDISAFDDPYEYDEEIESISLESCPPKSLDEELLLEGNLNLSR